MPTFTRRSPRLLVLLTSAILSLTFASSPAQAATETITVWTDSGNDDQPLLEALVKPFEIANPTIHVTINVGPTGVDAVNLVKARLAAGTMDDVFVYYTGSLFQALDPTKNLVDLASEPWQSKVISSYSPTVSIAGRKYGAPFGSAMGGGILYNKIVYRKLA
jgi:raffinose/stachyose/melibiose transport system substrate-binding protein